MVNVQVQQSAQQAVGFMGYANLLQNFADLLKDWLYVEGCFVLGRKRLLLVRCLADESHYLEITLHSDSHVFVEGVAVHMCSPGVDVLLGAPSIHHAASDLNDRDTTFSFSFTQLQTCDFSRMMLLKFLGLQSVSFKQGT